MKFLTFSKFTFVLWRAIFFILGLTSCKDEQLLRGMGLQVKEKKDKNHRRELFRKNPRKKQAN